MHRPVNVSSARATLALPPSGALCNLAMQTYSFPAPCWDLTSLHVLHNLQGGNSLQQCRRHMQVAPNCMQVHTVPSRVGTTVNIAASAVDLVARSTQTMRLPVTLGSNVPLCPVFSTRRMRLIPGHHLMRGGIGRLVQVNDAIPDVVL